MIEPANYSARWIQAILVFTLLVFGAPNEFGFLSIGCAQELPEALANSQADRVSAIARASSTAVGVFGPQSRGGGSGVVISADGYALTNYHVVQSCDAFMKCSMNDGELYDAVIVGIDPVGDVALIKLLGRVDFPFAKMADSDLVHSGDFCFAVGNPFLLATNFQPSVSWGIVSGLHRYQYPSGTILEYADCIQTDAAINPGNSGGPLFNAQGDLIGINGRGSFEKRGRVNVGVGYAISINQIKNFMDHLKSGRIVDHATMGATVATDDQGRVRVSNILESSQAFRRGLEYDDEILRFAGREIQTVNQFKNVLGIFPKGWRVPITFRRGDVEKKISIQLTGVHASESLLELMEGDTGEPELPSPKPDGLPHADKPEVESPARPEQHQHLFLKRTGFANYYFNLENRQRIWNGFKKQGDFTKQRFSWRLTGVDSVGRNIKIVLGDAQSGIQIDGDSFVIDPDSDLSSQLMPEGSGGLLVALHLWRQMLILGPDQFGEVIYFGSVPNRYSNELNDVLVATRGVVENNFLFNQNDHRLEAMEMYPDAGSDPCELYFEDYEVDRELSVPGTIKYAVGVEPPISIRIQQIEFLENESNRETGQPSLSSNQ